MELPVSASESPKLMMDLKHAEEASLLADIKIRIVAIV